jgi:hypothetical protein
MNLKLLLLQHFAAAVATSSLQKPATAHRHAHKYPFFPHNSVRFHSCSSPPGVTRNSAPPSPGPAGAGGRPGRGGRGAPGARRGGGDGAPPPHTNMPSYNDNRHSTRGRHGRIIRKIPVRNNRNQLCCATSTLHIFGPLFTPTPSPPCMQMQNQMLIGISALLQCSLAMAICIYIHVYSHTHSHNFTSLEGLTSCWTVLRLR